jgi:hypothetical protein
MADLVVTCPKFFWREWIKEGDPAGVSWSGEEWGWYMSGRRPDIGPGDRLYVVAWGRVRGYAPVTALKQVCFDVAVTGGGNRYVDVSLLRGVPTGNLQDSWCICRHGDAVAVTIPERVPGFRGWRRRWWPREHGVAFPDWQTFGVETGRRAA